MTQENQGVGLESQEIDRNLEVMTMATVLAVGFDLTDSPQIVQWVEEDENKIS